MVEDLTSEEKARLKRKDYQLRSKYKISLADYQYVEEQQSGTCPICNQQKQLVVDHCHKSNKVRGLICHNCNILLGHSKDNVNTLSNAINYLLDFKRLNYCKAKPIAFTTTSTDLPSVFVLNGGYEITQK